MKHLPLLAVAAGVLAAAFAWAALWPRRAEPPATPLAAAHAPPVPLQPTQETPRARAERLWRQGIDQRFAAGDAIANFKISRELFELAIEADPTFGPAQASAALHYTNEVIARRSSDAAADLSLAARYAQRAIAFSPEQSLAQRARAAVLELQGDLEGALDGYRRAAALRPQDASAVAAEGPVLVMLGRPGEAIRPLRSALSMDPLSISAGNWNVWLGIAMLHANEDDNGLAALRRAQPIRSIFTGPEKALLLSAALALNGDVGQARSVVARVRAADPTLSLARVRDDARSSNPAYLAQRERLLRGLALAGLD